MGLTFGQTVQLLSKEVWWLHRLDKCSCKQCTQPEVQKSYKMGCPPILETVFVGAARNHRGLLRFQITVEIIF